MTVPLVMVPEPVVALGVCVKAGFALAAAWAAASVLGRSPAATRHQAWMLGVTLALAIVALAPLAPRLPVPVPILLAAGRGFTIRALGRDLAVLSTLWLVGAIAVGVWLAAGHLVLARMAFRARRSRLVLPEGDPLTGSLRASGARVCWSDEVEVPLTWGVIRPVILLPVAARAWPGGRRRAALLHELAHVERRDPLAQALAAVVCTLFWFNPLAWLALARMRAECERACDDRVLRSGLAATRYASHLLAVARAARRRDPLVAAVGMATASDLEARVRAILDPGGARVETRRAGIALVVGALLLLLPLASLRPRLAPRIDPAPRPATVQIR